ncbi:beta-mannosidase [Undibacterium pigrum]|uniref:Beta-mannosidase B n=1 Tax=Undibacterium pigrum TaxID=401470 RepID=A0A318JRQ2_9BURK|nr:glycoside hydrolase family 2 protein [Undibacterium pigrum]PXX47030.1 beta-mannosidase [Undibacterium pigrum]
MHNTCLALLAASSSLFMPAQAEAVTTRIEELSGNWNFRLLPGDPAAAQQAKATQWHAAQVPGHVHTELLAHQLIDDPYVGDAEAALQWIGNAGWEYKLEFDLDKKVLKSKHQDLVFEGLDTFADIYLNGKKIAATDNAFRRWVLPAKNLLKKRQNELKIILHSPIQRLLPQVQAMPIKLAGNYPSPFGDEPRDAMTGNFARKPGYHYGWDWGPRYVTAGIWRSVKIISYDDILLRDFHIQQDRLHAQSAELQARLEVQADKDAQLDLELHISDPDGKLLVSKSLQASVKKGQNQISLPLQIENPRRWYPHGMGEQALYSFDLSLKKNKQLIAEVKKRTGLREIELRRNKDQWGQSFGFVINGIPVFAKGANLIPFDMLPNRVKPEQMRAILQSAKDANMNMLRLWGGGYYESDAFYDMADEMGLMLWQDFMFGGGVVPAYDKKFRENVVAEAKDQLLRLRSHPSIVLWCGNNEEETAWKDWGIGKKLREENPIFAEHVWAGYVALFGKDLREQVALYGAGVPYWSSSPSNDFADKANDSNNGDKHYWDVWAGSQPVEAYLSETPRFMSEFGLQAWPVQSTVDAFAPRSEQKIDGPLIRAHQKFLAGDGNQRLLLYIRANYHEPKDFADFIYLSQLMQAEGIEMASLHHRSSMPRTMGSLYWQLNDVWPGASWSSIDYFGHWKALHFHARRFFAPLTIAALHDKGITRLSAISDLQHEQNLAWRMRIMDVHGKVLRDETQPLKLPANCAMELAQIKDADLPAATDAKTTYVVVELMKDGKSIARSIAYLLPSKLMQLPDPGLVATIVAEADHYRLDLQTDKLARAVWLDFGGHQHHLSDNALSLLPGESISLRLDSKQSLAILRASLRIRHLAQLATSH